MHKDGVSFFFAGILTGVLAACVIGAFVIRSDRSGGSSGQIVLKLAHGLDEQHPVHQAMLLMKKREICTGSRRSEVCLTRVWTPGGATTQSLMRRNGRYR